LLIVVEKTCIIYYIACSWRIYSVLYIMAPVVDAIWTEDFATMQRLKALDDGWVDLQKMWDTKQNLFTQSVNLLVCFWLIRG